MLDFAWSEFALIGIVALLIIGPKDMPAAIRAVSKGIKKLRGLASEFQGHVDEFVREANLSDVQDTVRDLKSMGIKQQIMRSVDADGSLQRSLEAPDLSVLPPAVAQPDYTTSSDAADRPYTPSVSESGYEYTAYGTSGYGSAAGDEPVSPPADAPAILPPAAARLIQDRLPRLRRPAILPPLATYHGTRPVFPGISQAEH